MRFFTKWFMTVLFSLFMINNIMANGLNLNSVGARALGMGGAFVGLADDPTAIFWNPAGLSGQNTNLMFFVTDVMPYGSYKLDNDDRNIHIDAKTKTNHYVSPNIFFNYAMGDWSFGLGIFVPAGLGVEWNGEDINFLSFLPNAPVYDWKSKIGAYNFSPAVSYSINDKFSIGLALDIYYAMFEMDRMATNLSQYSEESTGTGFGATIGLKYNINDKISLGLSYRTPVNVSMDGTATYSSRLSTTEKDLNRDVTWPTWIGGGFAIHISEKWVVTADAQYTNWAEFQNLITDYTESGATTADTALMDWEDAIQYRVGTEYRFSDSFAGRLGYYYDPAPAPNSTLTILFPSSTNNVITGGFSYYASKFYVDLGLEYLFGSERVAEYSATNMAGTHQMDVFAFSVGVGYVFK